MLGAIIGGAEKLSKGEEGRKVIGARKIYFMVSIVIYAEIFMERDSNLPFYGKLLTGVALRHVISIP